MVQTVQAIYERGQLRLLDEATLAEGEQVRIVFFTDRQPADQILRVVLFPDSPWSRSLGESEIVAFAEKLVAEDSA